MRKNKETNHKLKHQLEIQSMVLPGVIFLIIFAYLPMIGVVTAFIDYNPVKGYLGSEFVGLKYFKELFGDWAFPMILKNTLGINLIGLAISFPTTIIFALMLNEIQNPLFKKTVQTVSYLPHFVSWVIFGGIIIQLLSPGTDGVINNLLLGLGLIKEPINFLGEEKMFWPILITASLIKGIGWSAIIYIAAIAGINPEHYEAATIDGAGRLQRTWYITLPGIAGTIIVMLIFEISGILNSGMDALLVLQNDLNYYASETIDFYVYHVGIGNFRYSYATAIGLLKSIVGLILLLTANFASKKLTDRGLF